MSMAAVSAAALMIAACVVPSSAVHLRSGSSEYEVFRQKFGVVRDRDVLGFAERVALFEQRAEEVRRHNAQSGRSWTAGLNKFTDFTDEEFKVLLGHRPMRRQPAGMSLFQEFGHTVGDVQGSGEALAQSLDWRQNLNSFQDHAVMKAKDQGSCGSCWAVAAAGALELHALKNNEENAQSVVPVSFEQLVDCVENLRECGGQGGCKGATAELALNYTHDNGLAAASDYQGYLSGTEGNCDVSKNPVLTTQGFVQLPVNENRPLLQALAQHGPVAVSADASGWSLYESGVYDGCGKDAILNHAILMMGYGTDPDSKKDYYLIRNSWGENWGEDGHMRLLRQGVDAADQYCGTDTKPEDGVGCKGGDATMEVCGMCGILADSAYPTGVQMVSN